MRIPRLDQRSFDLVFLDPPRYAKSPFGVVDIVHDYAALMKLALLCTNEGGTLICCNNAAEISREVWAGQLTRCAAKIGLNNDFKIPILSGMVLQVNIGKDSK